MNETGLVEFRFNTQKMDYANKKCVKYVLSEIAMKIRMR